MEPSETMNPDEHVCFPIGSLGYFISYGKLFNALLLAQRGRTDLGEVTSYGSSTCVGYLHGC